MSVASQKTDSWAELQRWRKYGEKRRSAFSFTARVKFAAVSAAARIALRVLGATLRQSVSGDSAVREHLVYGRANAIFVSWHNRLPGALTYHDTFARRNLGYALQTIVSASDDGEYLARMIRESSGLVIRGSSNAQAAVALRAAAEELSKGRNLFTVGDGPRGPRYVLKPGPLLLAKLSGRPIYPFTWACTRVAQFHRAWDQMMIPLPFSRIEYRLGEPLHVPEGATEADLAQLRRALEGRLHDLTAWADGHTGVAMQIPKPRVGEVIKRKRGNELEARRA